MDAENLKELLALGENYLRSHGGWRRVDEVMSDWGWRLARRKTWPHLDALSYWKTYGLRELIWCLLTVKKKMKVPVEADIGNSYMPDLFGEFYNVFDPMEKDREIDEDEVNDFVAWRKDLSGLLKDCSPKQRDCIERHAKGERLHDQEYMARLRGIRAMRERVKR